MGIWCLSIQQPHASAIIDGPKSVENRSWKPAAYLQPHLHSPETAQPEDEIWLAVHASKELYRFPEGMTDGMVGLRRRWPEAPLMTQYPRGCIIGLAQLLESVRPQHPMVADDPWARGPWCWRLGDRFNLLSVGVPHLSARGRLRLWRPGSGYMDILRGAIARWREQQEDPCRS